MVAAFDLRALLEDLQSILASLNVPSTGTLSVRNERSLTEHLKVTTNLSVRVGILESLEASRHQLAPAQEPLIDVVETARGPRVLIMLPGMRKEDVSCTLRNGMLQLRIVRGGDIFMKQLEICARASVRVRSVVENNSVVEISFARKKGGKKS